MKKNKEPCHRQESELPAPGETLLARNHIFVQRHSGGRWIYFLYAILIPSEFKAQK
jgi:hypothetical protein